MDVWVFDFEVFSHDWISVFCNVKTEETLVYHNDPEPVKLFINLDPLLCGFNNKWYDNQILRAVLSGADNMTIKEISDYMISGNMGWNHPWFISNKGGWFRSFDMFDDVQQGLSLKAIEGHLGLPIRESEVSFDLDRPLTDIEIAEVINYCKYDVEITKTLLNIRQDYLQGKLSLAKMKSLNYTQALYSTNAKLAGVFLEADQKRREDEREYQFPDNLELKWIPQDVMDFFGQLKDKRIPDDLLFKSKLNTTIGGCETTFGFGGVHGTLTTYHEQMTDTRLIQNKDVASMYPTLMIQYGYASRNIPSFEMFKDVYDRRMEAKHTGDKAVDKTLKLVLNSTFGAMGAKHNQLFDPLMFRSVTITGQLLLVSLAVELDESCPTLKLLNLNTDGVMFSVDKIDLPAVDRICEDWQTRSRMVLETDHINRVWIKDVNNLLFETTEGKIQRVGGFLNHGISVKGAWNINNNYPLVKDAVVDFFINGTPVEETINACEDILRFQMIAKASNLYSGVYQMIMGEKIPVQRCNRVYATTRLGYGSLYKTHRVTGADALLGSLPDSCLIDNYNQATLDDIDRNWYIRQAQAFINAYTGEKPPPRKNRRLLNALRRRAFQELENKQVSFFTN